jgi:hypothetical protein
MTGAESYARFGTWAFGIEEIGRYLTPDKDGHIDSTPWWVSIPERYWLPVIALIRSSGIEARYNGQRMTPEVLARFHSDVSDVIARELAP